jgi:hypothetical protein
MANEQSDEAMFGGKRGARAPSLTMVHRPPSSIELRVKYTRARENFCECINDKHTC